MTNYENTVWAKASLTYTGAIGTLGAALPTYLTAFTWNPEFLLASMYQDSTPPDGNRLNAPTHYCDKQRWNLTDIGSMILTR
jgi:hypothetical protein